MFESYGVTANEAAEALTEIMRLLPPPGEQDIALIKQNPTLTKWEKWKLIHKIRKNM